MGQAEAQDEQQKCDAGAATKDIIEQYVATIRSLREVDPPGVLLAAVGRPMKAYLQRRRDTIRCIVTALTDDSKDSDSAVGGESLFDELGRGATEEVHHCCMFPTRFAAMIGSYPIMSLSVLTSGESCAQHSRNNAKNAHSSANTLYPSARHGNRCQRPW